MLIMEETKYFGSRKLFVIVTLMSKFDNTSFVLSDIVKLRQGSGKDRQGMALKAKGLKAKTLA